MNSHQITEAALNRYESDKRAWEDAIRAYSGADSLDIWFNYICWLEQHKVFDKDGGFRKILEQCLSNFENFENYKQDVRMVKLWMKFIDMQANPLNLYQFLYKKNVGTQCACFYIGWAHYYDAANAFKQAESIYNLGIQVKAQPMDELQEAQNKFRLSIAQRMLYNDASSKKRSANTLVEQRQQITSLSPPQKKMKTEGGDYYTPQQQAVVQQHPQHQQNQVQNHVQPTVQQHQHHPQTQQPVHQPQQNYAQQGYYQQQQYQQQQHTSAPAPAPATMTAAEQYYQQDKQNSTYYQNNQQHYVQQHQQHPQHQVHQSQTPTPTSVQSTVLQQPHAPAQHHAPVQRQMQPQQQQLHPQVHTQNVAPVATQSRPPAVQPVQNPPHATMVQQPQIQPQPQPRVPPPQPVPVQPTPPPPQAQPAPQPQPTPQPVQSQLPEQPPVHRSVIIENYALGNESLTECNLNNSAYVISSSLNYVYDDANLTGYTLEEPQPEEKVDTGPTGIRLPDNFVREARSNHERWDVPLCLEEPYEANRKCCYPKGFVYPDLHTGKPTMEFSLEEIRARKWYRRKEELEEQKRLKQQQLEAEKQRQERQRQLQLQYQQQQQQQQQQQHYGHVQQHAVAAQKSYPQSNQYQPITFQQAVQQQQALHQYQPPVRQTTAVAASAQPVSTIQHASHYYQPQQQHHHHSANPAGPAQPVQHSPHQAPAQNSYPPYRHPYPSQPQHQQSQYQPPAPTPVIHHAGQHQPPATSQPVATYQPQSPYQTNHYGSYNQPNYQSHGQPVHQAAASPHHYAQQPTPQPQHHQHHPQQFHHQQHVHPPVQQQPPAAAFQPPAQTRPPVPVQYQKPAPQPTPPPPRPTTPHLQPPVKPVPPVQPIQRPPPPQKLLPPKQPPLRPPAPPAAVKPSPVNVRNNQFNDCDDIEEQIEASTIRFSTSAENGTCKSKTITIKFKKEKSSAPSPVNVPPGGPNHPQPKPMATSSANHLDANHHKPKNVPSVGISGSNSNSMAQPSRKNAAPGATPPERSKSNNVKKSKPSSSKAKSSSKYEPNATVVPAANRVNDANLLLSLAAGENDDSSQSYGGSSPEVVRQKKKDKNKSKVVRRYIDDDDDEEDVYEREEGEYLGDSEEDDFEDEEEDEEDSDENDSSYQSNSEFNTSFSNISFAGDNSNGAFNFGGSSCSTPMRKISGGGASKTSTPIGSFRYLKKHESNLSLLGQNEEDSMNSTVVENSYFQTEQDEEAKRRRKEKALGIIDTHLAKPFLDPFSSELCKAFLTKIDFPTRENEDNYKVVNNNLPKLVKSQTAALGGIVYSIEKEVGRGSYGSVFRAVNTQSGAVVAIKYQKPANSWELYICTEVRKRIKNPDILPGFMDICSAVIAPNASVLVSEFSQYGSLLDINNTIRTATTKVMHESLVMHFSSQILSIVDYLHKCNIVHADIKPDNFLLMQIPTVESDIPTLRLIDFGCAIDMNFFEKKRQFKKVIQTDGFTCIEMQEGRPWSFQTDLFCVAGTIHVMLFGEYMQLTKKYDSDWDIKQKLPRYLKKHVWTEVFQKLLNIKDIDHMPKLGTLKELIDAEAFNMESELVKHIRTLSNLLKRR